MTRVVVSTVAAVIVGLLLWFPVDQGLQDLHEHNRRLAAALGVGGWLLVLGAGYTLAGRGWALFWILPVLVGLLLIRFTWYGLIQFTGAGFTDEFFIHLEWESVRIAWQEYGRLARRAGAALLLMILVLGLAGRRLVVLRPSTALVSLLAGLALLALFRDALPERELVQAWNRWNQPIVLAVDEHVLERWQGSGLVETEIPGKRHVSAQVPPEPRNLIVLYLESVGVNLADQPDWPDLMPNFRALLDEHAWMDSIHTSSYITIEGITNSQCGTLFPFGRGSDSLAGGDGLAEMMPCLGDVLKEAGYHQVYLGGAGMSFAGKGEFLGAHGFDELKGMEYWQEQGLGTRPGKWGLSDSELFEQSLKEIEALREDPRPYNLTLLTIGTHLPGYLYRECEPYPHGEAVFLDALYCTDQLLGQWVDTLRDSGVLEDTVLVITADHHVFPNPEMRELFGEDVLDRRLPLIVLGPEVPEPRQERGAAYDLAPTILDFLHIDHNARFALGRSLARDLVRPDYLVKRYRDVHQDQAVSVSDGRCERESDESHPVQFPLEACEKEQLFAVLSALTETFSSDLPRLDCEKQPAGVFRIPAAADAPVRVVVGGRNQAHRFSWKSRTADPAANGLFLVELERDGQLRARHFVPENVLGGDESGQEWLPDVSDAPLLLALWRPSTEAGDVRFEVPELHLAAGESFIRLFDPLSGATLEEATADETGELVLKIDPDMCQQHFPGSGRPEA